MKRRDSRRRLVRKIEAGICICVACALCIAGGLAIKSRKEVKTLASGAGQAESGETEEATFFQNDRVEFEGKTYRRNTYMKAILCMGVDRAGSLAETTTTGSGGQADGVFLIAQDTARGAVSLLMIPRDTMTEITLTDLSGNELGEDVQHLNLAYAYGDGREKSCEYMVKAVSKLFYGFPIDYYLAANVDTISVLNDMAGGVTVTVPTEGMEQADPAFVFGETVTLKGKQAEKFVRYRDISRDHSALYRLDQQQEYIDQFFLKVREESAKDSSLVARMFESIEDNMVTNMSKDQYLKIALDSLGAEDISGNRIYTLPGEGIVTAKYDEFYPDEKGLKTVILSLFYREE